MSKDPIGLTVADISAFARRLAPELKNHTRNQDTVPSHLTLLNMLARAAGFRNYQHLRASDTAQQRLAELPSKGNIDYRLVERALHQFDAEGNLLRWPSRRPVQELCLWVMWSNLPAVEHLHEKEVNAILNAAHLYGDAALLRRSLVGMALVRRNLDGSDYQRLENRPPAEAQELIARIKKRRHRGADAFDGKVAVTR
ncbi:MAG: DUF2087 domain-containing protein [Sulfitobacter sp.]